jgi:hypothetical protein
VPKPLDVNKYPAHFMRILDRLKADPSKPVVLGDQTKSQAKGMQLSFVGFRNACEREHLHRSRTLYDEYGEPFDSPAQFPDLTAYITRVREKDGVFQLEIWHMDHTPEALAASAALDKLEKDDVQ